MTDTNNDNSEILEALEGIEGIEDLEGIEDTLLDISITLKKSLTEIDRRLDGIGDAIAQGFAIITRVLCDFENYRG